PKGQLNPAPYSTYGITITLVAVSAMLLAVLGTRRRIRQIEALEAGRAQARAAAAPPGFFQEFVTAVRLTPNVWRMLVLVFLV
ncbi:hypothetical protein, partial [Salmonella sp. SAL4450]|uniref:hypothetical protein n=1 Tax=Salmonella sp. SAL4450 TaxID=3159905 RepID=UPI00397877A4